MSTFPVSDAFDLATGIFAAAISGAIPPLLDLDERFRYLTGEARMRVRQWWWGFVGLNGALAGSFYIYVVDTTYLTSLPSVLRGLLVGVGFLSLARQKFATAGAEPIGIETLYNRARAAVYRRLEDIERDEIDRILVQEAERLSLDELVLKAERVVARTRLDRGEKQRWREWIRMAANDQTVSEKMRRQSVAMMIHCDLQRALKDTA